jgi:hypothetical protein
MTPYFRITLVVLAIIGGSMLTYAASAQEPRTATLTFDAVTHYTDNTPIPAGAVISYRVFQGTCGSDQKQLVGTITETGTTITSGLERGGNYGWQIVAVVNGEESELSNEDCKAFLVPKTVTITVR